MVAESKMDTLVEEFAAWLTTQKQLPQGIDKCMLRRFLYSMFGNLEGAKRLLQLNYRLRNKYGQIFLNRDPCDESSQQLLQVADLLPLPGLTADKQKLLLYRLIDSDADKFNFEASIKVFFMVADCRFAMENEACIADGEIPIFDMAGYTLRHLTRTTFSALRIYMKFVQEAHPVRLKEIHVVNCPSFLNKVLRVVKPLIKSEVFKLIHFHPANSDAFYERVPREMLPEEYGGQAGSVAELKRQWVNILTEKREYLMNPVNWKLVDSNTASAVANMRSMEID